MGSPERPLTPAPLPIVHWGEGMAEPLSTQLDAWTKPGELWTKPGEPWTSHFTGKVPRPKHPACRPRPIFARSSPLVPHLSPYRPGSTRSTGQRPIPRRAPRPPGGSRPRIDRARPGKPTPPRPQNGVGWKQPPNVPADHPEEGSLFLHENPLPRSIDRNLGDGHLVQQSGFRAIRAPKRNRCSIGT